MRSTTSHRRGINLQGSLRNAEAPPVHVQEDLSSASRVPEAEAWALALWTWCRLTGPPAPRVNDVENKQARAREKMRGEGFDYKNVAVEVFESDSGALTGPDGLEMRL